MSLILNIDTASEKAHVSFAEDGLLLASLSSATQKEHAAFLQTAIQQLCKTTAIQLSKIDAVAVTAGPGSYTGLRVGMASAKGLCYALKKPLIALSTLEMLTVSAIELFPDMTDTVLFCPMMDARRMEIYTAIYQKDLSIRIHPCALILDEHTFEKELLKNKIRFFGNGSGKWKAICINSNALFEQVEIMPQSMCRHSNLLYLQTNFADTAYCEPFYLKEFQSVTKNQINKT